MVRVQPDNSYCHNLHTSVGGLVISADEFYIHRYHPTIERAAQYLVRSLDEANEQSAGGPIDPFPIFLRGAQVLAVTVLCGASAEEAATLLDDSPLPMKRHGE